MTKYDDPVKQVAWEAYWEGYKQGRGTESYTAIAKRTARSQFERFWKRST